MARLVSIAALALIVLPPAAAQAGEARMGGALRYDGATGEVNRVTVAREGPRTFLLTDEGADVTAGPNCMAVSARQVRCTRPGANALGAVIELHDGNDSARGPAIIDGGPGDDDIFDTTRPDPEAVALGIGAVSTGGPGNDTVTGLGEGGEGNDTLRASPGRSAILRGGPGDDTVQGGTTDDFLSGGTGADRVASGGGSDTLSFADEATVPVVFSLATGPQGGRAGEADTYDGTFTRVIGDIAAGSLTGDALDNELLGNGLLRGLGGDDLLEGGTGEDTIEGGSGSDVLDDGDLGGESNVLDAGAGNDRVDVADRTEESANTLEREMRPTPDEVTCGPGKDRIDLDSADARPSDCEIFALLGELGSTITGTDGNDFLVGFSGDGDEDFIVGRRGDDRVVGLTGDDRLYGRSGDDRLEGDGPGVGESGLSSDDALSGGDGNDHLVGGFGDDRLTGGSGTDRLNGGADDDRIGARDGRRDKVLCGGGRDRVSADRGDRVSGDCEVVHRR
jgi:Ca2+-binding RTX toxin-like protein